MKTFSMWRIWAIVSVILVGIAGDVPASADEIDLQGSGVSVGPVVEGQTLNQVIGNFSDPDDPTATAGSFNALINWGDGTQSTGVITSNGGGGFAVSGTHTYGDELPANIVLITISSPGETGSVTFSDGFNVVEAETLTGTTFAASVLTPFSGQVASFTDLNLLNTAGDFAAVINWGDNTLTTGLITGNGSGVFAVSGTHIYAGPGQFTVTSTLQLDGFGDDSVRSTANISGVTTPEPSSLLLLGTGLLGLVGAIRRKRLV